MRADENASHGGGSLFGWLGLRGKSSGQAAAADAAPAAAAASAARPAAPVRLARQQLLETMSDFLLAHDLAISPDNLLAAHSAFAGRNPRLARQIAARVHAGEKVTQDWLDEITANSAAEQGDAALERLMGKLEENIETLSRSSKAARSATSEYNHQLERHVVDLHQVEDVGSVIGSLTDLARAMADRTRKVEQEMRKSEDRAKALRLSLARAKRDAEIDHLTGLPNRRGFEAVLERHHREAQAAVEALSVAFCDIDNFKAVNDTHGHETGDRVIRAIGETLAHLSNDNCHVARHGGEEFVMLFRGLTPAEAKARLDQAREAMSARNLVNRSTDAPIGQITFSGGVASVFGYPDPRAALAAADEALYRAKQEGRNRILIA
jgi:diguanylate cyclase